MSLDLILSNLLTPPVLFFAIGIPLYTAVIEGFRRLA